MPQKSAHRQAPGLTRHSRSASGGSSKLGLNLHFTQSNAPAKTQDKSKKNLAQDSRAPSFNRVNSGVRTQSKEQIQPVTQKPRVQSSSNLKPSGGKQKTGFTLSSPVEDEDEWVSSDAGSGAATPVDSSSDEGDDDDSRSRERSRTPVESSKLMMKTGQAKERDNSAAVAATPRAEPPMLSRIATARPAEPVQQVLPQQPPVQRVQASPPPMHVNERTNSHLRYHSEAQTERISPRHDSSKRTSVTRPPSMHSIRSEAPLRPHPLIRGHSYGQGILPSGGAAKPAPLAPLTVTSGSSVAQMSSSPPESSPSSVKTSQELPNRRTSISSVQTLPVTPLSPQAPNKQTYDRHRTLSTMSTASSSSFAALSSLALKPTAAATRPPTPQYTSHFPSTTHQAYSHGGNQGEGLHPLLPPPYLGAHLTVLATRNPVKEAFARVALAKQGR